MLEPISGLVDTSRVVSSSTKWSSMVGGSTERRILQAVHPGLTIHEDLNLGSGKGISRGLYHRRRADVKVLKRAVNTLDVVRYC